VGQATPGIIAVNTATFIGYKNKGIIGALFATAGVVFPSLVIIMIIAGLIKNFSDIKVVQNAFSGVRIVVCVLILNAVIKLWKNSVKGKLGIIIFILSFVAAALLRISPIYIVIISAIVGLLTKYKRGEK
jgi:chromate transporter